MNVFRKETVGSVYLSPVNKTTKIIGDIGFTIYRGENKKIKQHLKKSYKAVLKIAEYASVGMKFSDLCKFASNLFFTSGLKPSKRAVISSDQNQSLNIGHTIPGLLKNDLIFGNNFEEIRESIRKNRVHLIDTENFEIPETCAFTVESRLEDNKNSAMPSASWHLILCFDQDKKIILEYFSNIFKAVGMDYMNSKE